MTALRVASPTSSFRSLARTTTTKPTNPVSVEPGPAHYFARRADPDRIAKRLVAQLERLGHTVTLQTSTSTAEAVVAAPA